MWIWDYHLREMGFRQRSDRYWRCDAGLGLGEGDHVSLYLWTRQPLSPSQTLYQLTEFHVTFLLERDHAHFYYHEMHDNRWQPGGHTSSLQLRGLGFDPGELIAEADAIAEEFIARFNGQWIPREDAD